MMAQDWAVSTRKIIYHGMFINQFQLDIIKLIQQLERSNKKKKINKKSKYIYITHKGKDNKYSMSVYIYIYIGQKKIGII